MLLDIISMLDYDDCIQRIDYMLSYNLLHGHKVMFVFLEVKIKISEFR